MGIFIGFAALMLAASLQETSSAQEIPASPISQRPPVYPAACINADDQTKAEATVVVQFSVTRDGKTENVKVLYSTDACFEDVAVAAVRSWSYEPRRVDGKRKPQDGLQVTFTFHLEEETQADEFDATPLVRVPPTDPTKCMRGADDEEIVAVKFDVSVEGNTENVEVVSSTNDCFNKSATKAASEWTYRPRLVSGIPTERKDVYTQFRFTLGNSSEYKFRRAVSYRLNKIQRMLKRGDDPQEILDALDELEREFGDKFSQTELLAFHQYRAAARIEARDYAGALDDLRTVQSLGASGENREAVDKTIAQLEAAIAAEKAQAQERDEQEQNQDEAREGDQD